MRIILGSQSPRRKEIMDFFAIPFIQVPSAFDEESVPFAGDPKAHAMLLSQKKSEVLAKAYPADAILTADSVVSCNGKLYNKPADEAEAFQILSDLCGKWHSVFTGVTVRKGEKVFTGFEETKLLFHNLTPEEIKTFHKHCHFLDKAGGYAIEKSGSLIVSKMDGCYYNVLGLPVSLTRELFLKVGINLWDYLKSFA
jgi:septum formation protein